MRSLKSSVKLGDVVTYLALGTACVFALAPLVWGFLTSIKTEVRIAAYPPQWLPNRPTFKHYLALSARRYTALFLNSLVLSVGAITASLLAWLRQRLMLPQGFGSTVSKRYS